MIRLICFLLIININVVYSIAQNNFYYQVELIPVPVTGLQGLHSYAFAQHNGKWLIIGGRKDGVHAQQPFNAFPQNQNNTEIYVVDISSNQVWSETIAGLPTSIKEQLQSTNMNFFQDDDTLYIIGGYAYSATANEHITFPHLTTVQVSSLIDAIISGNPVQNYLKQISDSNFAVTGGQLGKIGNYFLLVGGQRFDGNYNPMGQPTFTQVYTNQIRKFTINNSGSQLSYSNYSAITDPVHLRRRDYNLIPQIFPDGSTGYTISSGVFQPNVDLPYLYPVDITINNYNPVTGFNQYLSNYHSAKACLYDSLNNKMHTIFFGGISQYYYQNGSLIQDNNVPFVKTISMLTRNSDGSLQELQLPLEMPALKGAGAEFILNKSLPHYSSDIIKLNQISQDTIALGYIYGGILSPSLNPFTNNQASTTSADNSVYEVRLINNNIQGAIEIDGKNPYEFTVFPNPAKKIINIKYNLEKTVPAEYFLTNSDGKILYEGKLNSLKGINYHKLYIDRTISDNFVFLTLIFDNKFFSTQKIILTNQ